MCHCDTDIRPYLSQARQMTFSYYLSICCYKGGADPPLLLMVTVYN